MLQASAAHLEAEPRPRRMKGRMYSQAKKTSAPGKGRGGGGEGGGTTSQQGGQGDSGEETGGGTEADNRP